MIWTLFEAKVGVRGFELFAESLKTGLIIFGIDFDESWISWKSNNALNAAQFMKNPPHCEINVELKDRSYLFGELQL